MKRIISFTFLLTLLASNAHAGWPLKNGSTSKILEVFIADSSVTTGAGKTGLAYNTASLVCYYYEEGAGTGGTQITMASSTLGTYTSGCLKEIDATNMPGWYEFCPPNAALDGGIGKSVVFICKGASNMAPMNLRVDLTPPSDINAYLGTASPTADTAGYPKVTIKDGTGTGEIDTASGYVLADTSKWNGTAVATPDTAGYPKITIKDGTGTGEIDTNAGAVVAVTTATTCTTATTATTCTNLTNLPSIPANWITAAGIANDAIGATEIADGALDAATFKEDGTAQSCTGTTMVLASAETYADSELVGREICIVSGTGKGQCREITANVGSTDTVTVATWTTTCDNTSKYVLGGMAKFSSVTCGGTLTANVTQWNGTNVATPDTAGYPKCTIKDGTGTGEIDTNAGAVVSTTTAATCTTASTCTNLTNLPSIPANWITAAGITNGALGPVEFGYDGTLVSKSGTTLGLASGGVDADNQFITGTEIQVFDSAGLLEARSCIVSSANAGDTVVTAEDISALVSVADGYRVKGASGCSANVARLNGNLTAGSNLTAMFDGTGYIGGTAKLTVDTTKLNGVDTSSVAELSALPGATPTLLQMIQWVYQLMRFQITQTATTATAYKANSSTSLGTSTTSDDGTTFTRGKFN